MIGRGRRRVQSFSRQERVCIDLTRVNHYAASGLGTVLRLVGHLTVGARRRQ
jgi:hypothetical protein